MGKGAAVWYHPAVSFRGWLTVQYSTVQYSIVRYSAVQCSTSAVLWFESWPLHTHRVCHHIQLDQSARSNKNADSEENLRAEANSNWNRRMSNFQPSVSQWGIGHAQYVTIRVRIIDILSASFSLTTAEDDSRYFLGPSRRLWRSHSRL